jgi:hypothetical protein
VAVAGPGGGGTQDEEELKITHMALSSRTPQSSGCSQQSPCPVLPLSKGVAWSPGTNATSSVFCKREMPAQLSQQGFLLAGRA